MNFFAVDDDPRQAARDLCDKHVWKMHTEGIQMFVQLLHDLDIACHVLTKDGEPHKGCHAHPCLEWLKQSRENLIWAVDHVDELINEHHDRKDRHDEPVVSWHQLNVFFDKHFTQLMEVLPDVPRTPFAQAFGPNADLYRGPDGVEAYRAYYIGDKVNIAEWRYCDPPQWWVEAFDYAGVS